MNLRDLTQVSVGSTYPLDLVRARLSIATSSIPLSSTPSQSQPKPAPAPSIPRALSSAYHTSSASQTVSATTNPNYTKSELTILGMTLKIIREEGGVRGLYRGLVATAFGVAPYVGINFAAYEALRAIITPPGKSGVARKLACGALAGMYFLSHQLLHMVDSHVRWVDRLDIANFDLSLRRTSP